LRRRNEPRLRKSIVVGLLRDIQGTAAGKLALVEKLKVGGGFAS
jgi:hypothetical protein